MTQVVPGVRWNAGMEGQFLSHGTWSWRIGAWPPPRPWTSILASAWAVNFEAAVAGTVPACVCSAGATSRGATHAQGPLRRVAAGDAGRQHPGDLSHTLETGAAGSPWCGAVPVSHRHGTRHRCRGALAGPRPGMDVRHRFFQHKRLHVATIPSFNVALNPVSTLTTIVDVSLPLVLELDVGNNLAIIADLRVTLRNELVPFNGTLLPRLAVLPGVGTRLEWTPKKFRLGLSVAWIPQSGRGGEHGVSAGLDFGARVPNTKTRRARKKAQEEAEAEVQTPSD